MSKTEQKIRNLEIHLASVDKKLHRLQEVAAQVRRQIELLKREAGRANGATPPPNGFKPTLHHQIEADAGTSANIPPHFGLGYGSYKIDQLPVVSRLQFGPGHSNNSAEIEAIVCALQALSLITDAANASVLIRSDSKIALKWCTCTDTPKEKTSPAFKAAIKRLHAEAAKFSKIRTQWRGRIHSVNLFGH